MAAKPWMLLQDAEQYKIGCTADSPGFAWHAIETSADASPEETATAIAEKFQTLGYCGEGVLLAVNSSACLAASFSLENHAAGRQRQTLLYQFEQYLPLAAEDIAADFVVDGCKVFGVAVPCHAEKLFIDAMEQRGICIQSLVPLALLAVQQQAGVPGEACLILWQYKNTLDWISISAAGRPSDWRLLPADIAAIVQNLHVETLNRTSPLKIIAHACSSALLDAIASVPNVQIHAADEQSMLDAASKTAETILSGKANSWIELRRDGLGTPDPYRAVRGPMKFAIAAAVALAVAIIAGFSYRAYSYDQLALIQQERQTAAFRQIFPGQSTPLVIRARLESEHKKLAGTKGDSGQLPQQTSALATLYNVLAAMPGDVRYRFHELRLDRQRIYLDGEVLSHGDADKISSGLRSRGFQVQPPRTQQLSGNNISVRITAELAQKPKTPGAVK